MKCFSKISVFLLFVLFINELFAQEHDKDLIQISGVVVSADSIQPVPFTHIIIINACRGTISDYYGYFSFVAQKNDTVLFSSVGYKKGMFVIPDTISKNRYSLIQVLVSDTIMLAETVIYPWPTKEQFKEAFINLKVPDDGLAIARKNLDPEEMRQRAEYYGMDGSMNYRNYIYNETSKLYYIGQTQPITILNPFAWAQFIKAWREGKFKRKKKN